MSPAGSLPSPETGTARRPAPMLAVALACGGMLTAFALAEVVLRVAHFQFRSIPEVQFGWPEPQVILNEFDPDPELLWVTRDYRARLSRARRQHAPVIFMGD